MDAFVTNHLRGVSRTYALVVPMLPDGLANAVGLAYLLMRIIDTLEDDPRLTPEQRAAGLHRLAVMLEIGDARGEAESPAVLAPTESAALTFADLLPGELGETPAERHLLRDAPLVIARLNQLDPDYRAAVATCGRTMIAGVCKLLDRSAEREQPYPAIRDAAELREYCYYVAGCVGEMLCTMMSHFLRLPALLRLRSVAVELGVGLQLVNILKDALRDAKHGRRYLPSTAGGDVSATEIYRAVLSEARASLQRGVEFVLALPAAARELRAFCGLPLAWGALTLARAERNAGKAKISRGVIRASIDRFWRLADNDGALRNWLSRLLSGPKVSPASFPR